MRTAEVTDQPGDFQAVVDVGLVGVLADLLAVGARRTRLRGIAASRSALKGGTRRLVYPLLCLPY